MTLWLMRNDFRLEVGHRFTFHADPVPGAGFGGTRAPAPGCSSNTTASTSPTRTRQSAAPCAWVGEMSVDRGWSLTTGGDDAGNTIIVTAATAALIGQCCSRGGIGKHIDCRAVYAPAWTGE
jgi:hypothetical protein